MSGDGRRFGHDRAVSTRIGIVGYANVAPLVEGLEAPAGLKRFVPSDLADAMARGEIDLGMLPVIELARMRGARALPHWGIAADGASESVLLFSKRPLAGVSVLAQDASSRTSNVLARIVLDREGARDFRCEMRGEGSLEERLESADAVVLIGDPALAALAPEGIARYDLATEWKRHVGLPFVFATWAVRADHEVDAATRAALDAAAERGLERLDEIAASESRRTGLPRALLERYYRTLDYRLSPRHWAGLRAFLDEAWRIGALEERAEVEVLS
jgi:chorismate dehydratase